MSKEIEIAGGVMVYRDDFDREVIREVIENDEYRRWGDITIKPGDVVVDCGAHIGSFTRLALLAGARVLAIEPHPDNFRYLTANTEGASNVKLIQAILWDGQDVDFYSDPIRNELHKVCGLLARMSNDTRTGTSVQPSITLDSIIESFGIEQIDLLKMDIEGAEYNVLYGMKKENLAKIQQLTMEWHYGSTELAKLIIYLEENGFKVVWLGGNGQWGKLQCKRSII